MNIKTHRKAILKHQYGRTAANLLWGPVLSEDFIALAWQGCEKLSNKGYFANLFPEGDGVTLSHPKYQKQKALQDVCAAFPWLLVDDETKSIASLYGDSTIRCKILVPVEKLLLTAEIVAQPYRFIPAVGEAEDGCSHPWHKYLSAKSVESLKRMRGQVGSFRITEETLLTYPLIELSLDIPYSELCTAQEYMDGMVPLLRRCAEFADRGLDLLRLYNCDYNRPEHLPATAGQLQGELGLHAAFVIPQEESPFKPKLYCHIAYPFQVMPNWLGLEVSNYIGLSVLDLAPIVFQPGSSEMSQRIRGAVRSVGQSLYIATPEARFMSLVSALDGLCAPNKRWRELSHQGYIAVIASNGDVSHFEKHLRWLNEVYTNVRNPIVHRGGSFIELGMRIE